MRAQRLRACMTPTDVAIGNWLIVSTHVAASSADAATTTSETKSTFRANTGPRIVINATWAQPCEAQSLEIADDDRRRLQPDVPGGPARTRPAAGKFSGCPHTC